ncbi:hypothetical protein [Stappia indica]|uniref:hypothetical protein n=1 Tax=Stappia indica TaxID=538381 RepID=UPI001CD31D1D|nr:hypothetical protein [Stappia indica]MCA1300578.1 hypothetical protein [Stappia indica]
MTGDAENHDYKTELTTEAAPTTQILRLRLQQFARALRKIKAELETTGRPAGIDLSDNASSLLAATAISVAFPVEDLQSMTYRRALAAAKAGKLGDWREIAVEEIACLIDIVEKAKTSLHTLDVFDKPPLPQWSNLPAQHLARAINSYAHLVFQAPVVR